MAEAKAKGTNLDIGRLVRELQEATDWFKVGMRLRIKHYVLKRIEVDHKGDGVERCMLEMLVYWRDNDRNPSIKKLADALQDANYSRVARQVRRNYNVPSNQTDSVTIGTLPDFDEAINPHSHSERKVIHRKCMIDESDSMLQREYGDFMRKLLKILESNEVSVDDAIFVIKPELRDESALTSDMQEAIDMQSFLAALSSTQSWYDFDVTACLALNLGGDEGKKLVETYETKLKVHLTNRRKIYRYRGGVRTRRFVIKVNEKPELFMEEKKLRFRVTIARLLNLEQEDLELKSARKGCVELTYLFRADLASHIKSAIKNCGKDLHKHNVMSVKIDSEFLWTKIDSEQSAPSQKESSDPGPKRLSMLKEMREHSRLPLQKIHTGRQKMRSFPMPSSNPQKRNGHPCYRVCCQLILCRHRKHCNIVCIIIIICITFFALYMYYFSQS